MYSNKHSTVELICNNDLMDAIIDRFGENVTSYANDTTSFRVVADVEVRHVFYKWVFGFGGKVKIKGLAEVKEAYANMLYDALTN